MDSPAAYRPLRLGLIIPSSNRCTEPQFHRYAPPQTDIHVTRLRMTGPHHAPLPELLPRIAEAALLLADTKPDLIVFHCTGTAMEEGPEGEERIIETIRRGAGRPAITTATGVVSALRALGASRLAVASPYREPIHRAEAQYLEARGYQVLRQRAMGLAGSDEYLAVSPEEWVGFVLTLADPEVEAYFVACANIRATEVILRLERELGRPVITSNQATLWYSLRWLGRADPVLGLGRLFQIAELPAPVAGRA